MGRALKPCGTRAACMRHLRNGEQPCDACAQANKEYGEAYRHATAVIRDPAGTRLRAAHAANRQREAQVAAQLEAIRAKAARRVARQERP